MWMICLYSDRINDHVLYYKWHAYINHTEVLPVRHLTCCTLACCICKSTSFSCPHGDLGRLAALRQDVKGFLYFISR